MEEEFNNQEEQGGAQEEPQSSPEPQGDAPEVDMKGHVIKWGGIVGVLGIILGLLFYIIDVTLFAQWWLLFVTLIINLVLVIYAGIDYRKQLGGFIPFGKAFMHGLATFAIAGLIGTIFNIILFTVIDPDAVAVIVETSIENTEEFMERFGTPPEQIDEQIAKLEEDMPGQFGVMGQITGYLWAFIFYAIFALISGAIVKRKEPEPDF